MADSRARRFEIPRQHVETALAALLVQVHWYESRCKDVPEHIWLAFESHAFVLGKVIYSARSGKTQVV